MQNKLLRVAVLFFLAQLSRGAEPVKPAAPIAYASPEAVYKAYREACFKRDWRTVWTCFTTERQKEEIFECYFTSQFKPEKYLETLKKHRLESEKVEAVMIKAYEQKHRVKSAYDSPADLELSYEVLFNLVADKPGFYKDMCNLIVEPGPMKLDELKKVTLQENTAQGDTMTIMPGPVLANGQPANKVEQRIPKVVNFAKINGGWLIIH